MFSDFTENQNDIPEAFKRAYKAAEIETVLFHPIDDAGAEKIYKLIDELVDVDKFQPVECKCLGEKSIYSKVDFEKGEHSITIDWRPVWKDGRFPVIFHVE